MCVLRWEKESGQIRRDQATRYFYRKDAEPIPVWVSKHRNIDKALEAFEAHDDFGDEATIAAGSKLGVTAWLLDQQRPFNVKFEHELKGDDGAIKVLKSLRFNHDKLHEVVTRYGNPSTFETSATRFVKSFKCPTKRGDQLHKCWSNDCSKCSIREHFRFAKKKRKCAFEKKYGMNVPAKHMVEYGYYQKSTKNGQTRFKWYVDLIPWKEFLEKYSDYCADHQTWLHVYQRFCDTTLVTFNPFFLEKSLDDCCDIKKVQA